MIQMAVLRQLHLQTILMIVNAFGKNNADDFYITVRDSGGWKDDTFVINNTSGNISLGYDLSVTGAATISGTVSSSGYIDSSLGSQGETVFVGNGNRLSSTPSVTISSSGELVVSTVVQQQIFVFQAQLLQLLIWLFRGIQGLMVILQLLIPTLLFKTLMVLFLPVAKDFLGTE